MLCQDLVRELLRLLGRQKHQPNGEDTTMEALSCRHLASDERWRAAALWADRDGLRYANSLCSLASI